MYVTLLLLLCISSVFGQIHTGVSNQELLPREWKKLVKFVNQKIGHFERLMNVKDRYIGQLESKLQNREIMQLKEDVRLLHQVMSKHADIHGQTTHTVESTSDLKDINVSNLFTLRENTNWTKFTIKDSLTSANDYKTISADDISIPQYENIQNPRHVQLGASSLRKHLPYDIGAGNSVSTTSSDDYESHRKSSEKIWNLEDEEIFTEQGLRQTRVATEQTIAFHALLSHTVVANPHSTVVFDQEQLDQGDGYNPHDGIYSVPASGTYVITWTLMADRHASFQSQLIVNGVALGNSFTDADEVGDLHQTSATIVLALSKGDHVFVRIGHIARGKISTEVSNPTFSGWKTS